jgi:benzoyl-CoA 2,3-epoxidase subunit B
MLEGSSRHPACLISARLRPPSKRFYRHIGLYADLPFDPDGRLLDKAEWQRRRGEWLPTEKDRAYVATLQKTRTH